MSTKIYNGIKFKSNNLIDVLDFCDKLREKAPSVIKKCGAKFSARAFAYIKDNLALKGELRTNENIVNQIICDYRKLLGDALKRETREPLVDMSLSLTIHPLKDKEIILGIYFAQNKDMSDIVTTDEFIEDYHYQNQTDFPEGISKKDWEIREQDWDKALKNYDIPSLNGFSATIVPETYIQERLFMDGLLDKELVNSFMPSYQYRIDNIKKEIGFDKFIKNFYGENFELKNRFFEYYDKYNDFLKTNDGKDFEKNVIDDIKKKIDMNLMFNK